jgi:hypothetical protein
MIEEEKNPKVHHMTAKAARTALAHRQISRESYAAVLRGEITLQRARELGRHGSPADTAGGSEGPGRASGGPRKGREPRPCVACGGMTKGGRFHPGCDAKMYQLAWEYARGERDLTPEQLAYMRDETDKLERARVRVEREAQEGDGA